jgi:hypothetical protein
MRLRVCTVLTWMLAALPAPAWAQDQPLSSGDAAGTAQAVFYEEDVNTPEGKRSIGFVIWRAEMETPAAGKPSALVVRADVEIPGRAMNMTWTLRRNTGPGRPSSHTIEMTFGPPLDSGGIFNVPGVLMKAAEQARGTPLAGLAVKITEGHFLLGLSAVPADKDRNIQLLNERSWFDIPIVFANKRRALLAMEKGSPGEHAFQKAFEAWSSAEGAVTSPPPETEPSPLLETEPAPPPT